MTSFNAELCCRLVNAHHTQRLPSTYAAAPSRKLFIIIISDHIISYHIVDLKRQNRLKVGANKPKLKAKIQSVSDDV